MKLLFATSEIAPWVKTGGLGDVAGALPSALAQAGCDVRVLVPAYPALLAALAERRELARVELPGGVLPAATLWEALPPDAPPLWLLESAGLFNRHGNPYLGADGHDWPDNVLRFGLLSRVAALLASADSPVDWRPDVLHCNDWQTGLAPAFLRYLHAGRAAASLLTVHNLSFHGLFDPWWVHGLGLPGHAYSLDGVEFHGRLSFLKAGLQCADRITTVSPTYAAEILSPQYGCGLEGLLQYRADRLTGILNGIDLRAWDPSSDPALTQRYDAQRLESKASNKRSLQRRLGLSQTRRGPLLGVVSRLTEQKGLDLFLAVADALLEQGAQIALLGSGDRAMEQGFRDLSARHPRRCACVIGFDETLAHRIEAGADIFVMPSRFEPCGLNQMYSLRYGTPPVVRRTGGLADTVVDADAAALADGRANGFVFDEPSAAALLAAIERALGLYAQPQAWQRLQRTGMAAEFGWEGVAARYVGLYGAAIADRSAA